LCVGKCDDVVHCRLCFECNSQCQWTEKKRCRILFNTMDVVLTRQRSLPTYLCSSIEKDVDYVDENNERHVSVSTWREREKSERPDREILLEGTWLHQWRMKVTWHLRTIVGTRVEFFSPMILLSFVFVDHVRVESVIHQLFLRLSFVVLLPLCSFLVSRLSQTKDKMMPT
jgi:hypothetical protein